MLACAHMYKTVGSGTRGQVVNSLKAAFKVHVVGQNPSFHMHAEGQFWVLAQQYHRRIELRVSMMLVDGGKS